MLKLTVLACLTFVCLSSAFELTRDAKEDEVTNLPGLRFRPKFKHFAGYLRGADATQKLFYWFFESQDRPDVDPLVLWLNGGPGCSSLMGATSENGPFTFTPSKTLVQNMQSWNKQANMLYIEAPAGVGFSYSIVPGNRNDDDSTSLNTMAALKNFLVKFPQYKLHDFYITGESYGGIYVPTLAMRVIKDGTFKLQAVAIGNGLSNYEKNDNSLIYFAYNHGLIETRFWRKMFKACCPNADDITRCYFTRSKSLMCQSFVRDVFDRIQNGLNIYNLYGPCIGGATENLIENQQNEVKFEFNRETLELSKTQQREEMAQKIDNSHLSKDSHSDFQNLFRDNIYIKRDRALRNITRQQAPLRMVIPCSDSSALASYFNDPAVKAALHARPNSPPWDVCSDDVNENYDRIYNDTSVFYNFMLNNNVRVLVYNGDVDMACNYLGDEWFLDDLNLKLTRKYVPWFYTDANGWKQVGGYAKQFSKQNTKLTFATILGSGHMVPTDRPIAAKRMFDAFLANKNL